MFLHQEIYSEPHENWFASDWNGRAASNDDDEVKIVECFDALLKQKREKENSTFSIKHSRKIERTTAGSNVAVNSVWCDNKQIFLPALKRASKREPPSLSLRRALDFPRLMMMLQLKYSKFFQVREGGKCAYIKKEKQEICWSNYCSLIKKLISCFHRLDYDFNLHFKEAIKHFWTSAKKDFFYLFQRVKRALH